MEDHVLMTVLRLSRYVGIAPYRSLHREEISRAWTLYGRLLFACFGILLLTLTTMDIYNKGLYVSLKMPMGLLNYMRNIIIIAIIYIGMLQAPIRMRRTFYYLKVINKIRRCIGHVPYSDLIQRKVSVFFVGLELMSLMICLYTAVVNPGKTLMTICLSWIFTIINLMILRFVLIAATINSLLRAINEQLEEILSRTQSNEKLRDEETDGINGNSVTDLRIPVAMINRTIDMLATEVAGRAGTGRFILRHKKQRSLAAAYVTTCNLVRQLNYTEKRFLLFINIAILIQLFCNVYNIIRSASHSGNLFSQIIEPFIYIIHIYGGLLIVSPNHTMSEELGRTRRLIYMLLTILRSDWDPQQSELDIFSTHLTLNQPSYAILDTYTLNRSFIITLMAIVTSMNLLVLSY